MPDTRLILHVKGTEAETSELPKEAVREAISQGKISQSQLIWSPTDSAWKQVREWPDLLPPTEQLILHVKGTEAETRQVPKQEVRAGISQGHITHSQLIWSPNQNVWKQVRELPELLPSQKLAPAPAPTKPLPKTAEAIVPESPVGPVARAAVAAGAKPQVRTPVAIPGGPASATPAASAAPPKVRVAGTPAATPQARAASPSAQTPQVKVATATPGAQTPRVATAGTPAVRAAGVPSVKASVAPAVRSANMSASSGSHVVDHEDSFHPFKWICIALGVLIVLILGANYLLVDQPLVSKLSKTHYSGVSVYAHFGAFMQPSVIVIHIPPSSKITSENLPDILIALARSTPNSPTSDLFTRVAITSAWRAQYSFSGSSWKQLGEQDQEGAAQRKEFIMGQMDDASGQSMLPESTLNEEAQKAKRDQAWNEFVSQFAAKP